MARPQKEGLDYFPLNVDFFDDDKLQLIDAEFGEVGVLISIKLLCKIYKENGYYYQWGKDECLLFAKKAGSSITPAIVDNVIESLVRRDFFDKDCFKKYQVLTSAGIQKRFIDAVERRKHVELIREIIVIDNIIKVNANINAVYVSINPQSKVKESIEEESSEPQASPHPPELTKKYDAFNKWLTNNAPKVLKLKEPITIEQYQKLLIDFPNKTEILTEVLTAMHNKADLLKKYTSANLTLRNWIKSRLEKTPILNDSNYQQARAKAEANTARLASL